LIAVAALVLATAALLLAVVIGRAQLSDRARIEQMQARIKATEQMQTVLARSYRGLTAAVGKGAAEGQGDDAKYARAAELITRGAGADELARTLALPLEEAELMIQLNVGKNRTHG
jgi:hypothetical protein